MFVVAQDFYLKPFNLVNLPEDGTFDDYVSENEERILRDLLGNYLYDLLVDAFNILPSLYDEDVTYVINDEVTYKSVIWKSLQVDNLNNVPVEGANWTAVIDSRTKWAEVIYGGVYVYETTNYKWSGMKAMVKPLIFSLWLGDNASNTNSSGVTVPRIENAERINPDQLICRGWNLFIDLACGKYKHSELSVSDSLFGYLYSNAADFDSLFVDETCKSYLERYYTNLGRKNIFGI